MPRPNSTGATRNQKNCTATLWTCAPTAKEQLENCPKPPLSSANLDAKNAKPQDAAPANAVFLVHPAQPDVTVAMVHPVTLVSSAHLAIPYHSAMNISRNSPNNARAKLHQAAMENLAVPDSPACPETTANQETQALPEIKDNPEIPAAMAVPATPDPTASLEILAPSPPKRPDHLANPVVPAPTAHPETLDNQDHPETTATMALPANKAILVSPANPEAPANLVVPEKLETPEQLAVAISVLQLVWLLDIKSNPD